MNNKPTDTSDLPSCEIHKAQHTHEHSPDSVALSPSQIDSITVMLKALADSNRLQLLLLLQQCSQELCVSEIVEATGDKITTVSNRLKQLHDAGLVNKRRDGQHIFYSLQDAHVDALLSNLIAHASHEHS